MKRYFRALQFSLSCALLINFSFCQCPFSGQQQSYAYASANGASSYVVFDGSCQTQNQTSNPQCPVRPTNCQNNVDNYYYRSYDGSCNNFQNPDYGMAFSRYNRLVAPNYGDGFEYPSISLSGRPYVNPRTLSLKLFGEETIFDNALTLLAMQFGQQIAHDLTQIFVPNLRLDCCAANATYPACFSFATDLNDPMRRDANIQCLSFPRANTDATVCGKSLYKYAEKITRVTGFLDCSNIYGISAQANADVRTFSGGQFKTSNVNGQSFLPISVDSGAAFVATDARQTNIPGLAAIHNLLVREHNRVASKLAYYNPHWNDEKIFQETRRIVIAEYQKISYYDYFALILGKNRALQNRIIYNIKGAEFVDDYNAHVNAGEYVEFAMLAFRYLHNMIPGTFPLVSRDYFNADIKRLSDFTTFAETVGVLTQPDGLSAVLRGLVSYKAKAVDNNIDKEIKHFLFRQPGQLFGRDLKAIDIQRARDFGIGTYNSLRKVCGLKVAQQWSDFSDYISPQIIESLKQYYVSPDDVEAFVAGFERHLDGSQFGPTFSCIVFNQLRNIRRGDRFWFELPNQQSGFTSAQLYELRKISFSSLICANTDVVAVQSNAFLLPSRSNQLLPCQNFPQLDLSKWREIPSRQTGYY